MAFVRAHVDLYCNWSKREPRYRIFVNDELMTERTWRWTDVYLEEMLQLEVQPGQYRIKVELLDSKKASLKYQNLRVIDGNAEVIGEDLIRVYP